jgi:hypothetical protein
MRLVEFVASAALLGCTSSGDGVLPEPCSEAGNEALNERACTKALDEYCASEDDEDSCSERSPLRVGGNSTVRCGWGDTATITDEETCTMTRGGRCYAALVDNDVRQCVDFCEEDSGYLRLFDNVLIRLQCQSGFAWSGMVFEETADASYDNPVGYHCFANDSSPDVPLCDCAEMACDVLD